MATKTTAAPEAGAASEDQLTPLFHVVLLDDDEHTYDYVIEMLMKIFCHSPETAFRQLGVQFEPFGREPVRSDDLIQLHPIGPGDVIP
jgi:ATP-dependent Clp protease adaptor protein ClpS